MNRNIGASAGFLAVLAVLMRALLPSAQVNEPAAAGKPPAPAAKNQPVSAEKEILEGPWLATRHFYGVPGEPGPADSLLEAFGIADPGKVSFLLATVPDPLHSRLSLFTDNSIQAIQKAATDAGWRFATQWMPWNDTIDPDEKDPKVRREQRADIERQEERPGVMVFRSGLPEDAAVLMVFLVGETPTAGIDSVEFQVALGAMDAIHRSDEIRIQGPTFSGSFASLGILLRADRRRNPARKYRIRSGTVTDEVAGNAFRKEFEDFHSAMANTADQTRYFHEALAEMRIPEENAALLVEDESDYGESVAVASKIKVFRFPRDIAHLRNAYREAVQSYKPENAPAPDLNFSLEDATTGEDSVPIFSGAESPLSQNGVVNQITSAIRRDDIRMVQVSATNVFDLLFLAEVLKQRCPDTRLMVSSPDVLFIQAAQTGKLAGTLALSSYPMFYANNRWMGWEQNQHPQLFADATSEGAYNATLLLLSKYATSHLADYRWRSLYHPPTWVLLLDRQGFLPVNVLPHKSEEETNDKWFQKVPVIAAPPPRLPAPPGLWSIVSTALAVVCLLISIWIFTVTCLPALQVDASLTFTSIDPESIWRRFFLFLFLMLLVSMLVVIWSPLWLHREAFSLMLPGFVAGAALLSPALLILLGSFCGSRGGGVKMLSFGLAPVAAALSLWLRSCFGGADRGLFFSLRALELRLGSSPTWPILAALGALVAWAFAHVTRFYLVACLKPEALTTGIETVLQTRLDESIGSFNASLESPTGFWNKKQRAGFAVVLAIAALVCLLGRIGVKLRSIEGASYDYLSLGLQSLVMLALLGACWQIGHLWHSFQAFLRCLGELPLATSFIGTDGSASKRPIWVRRLNLQCVDIYLRGMVVLHDMTLLRKDDPKLAGWTQAYRKLLNALLDAGSQRTRGEVLESVCQLRQLDKEIAGETFDVARRQWTTKPLAARMLGPQLADAGAKQSDDRYGDLAQNFLALHYSSFILYAIAQIRNLALFLSIGFVLLVFSMSSYSFQAPQFAGRFLLVLFVILTWVVWRCLAGMERDPIVSRIGGTDPDKLSVNFYFKLAGYGLIPLLGLLASQFPSIANFLLSSVEPALEALK